MTEPITVTEELRAAWDDFHDDASSTRMRAPDPTDRGADGWYDGLTLAGLQRVLERFKQRTAEGAP